MATHDEYSEEDKTGKEKYKIDWLLLEGLPSYYLESEIERALTFYVNTNWQNIPPSQEQEMKDSIIVATRGLTIPHLFKNVFPHGATPESDKKFFLILADSGMGKTTLLINIFYQWKKKEGSKKHIRMYHIGKEDTWKDIKGIHKAEKQKTILLLDSFDEDAAAIKDQTQRLQEIILLSQDFNKVIITCRSQFLPSSQELPIETKVLHNNGIHRIARMYISPFSDEDIGDYLDKKEKYDPSWDSNRRRAAQEIIERASLLMVRPMLLAHIDDLLDSDDKFEYSYQIYEQMVERWIEREANKKGIKESKKNSFRKELRKFSEEIAYELRDKPEHMIYHTNIEPFAKKHGIGLEKNDTQSRSLLNHNSHNYYKFSHKSVLEYFLMNRFFRDKTFAKEFNFEKMSEAKKFQKEMMFDMIPKYFREKDQNIKVIIDQLKEPGIKEGMETMDNQKSKEIDLRGSKTKEEILAAGKKNKEDNLNLSGMLMIDAKLEKVNLNYAMLVVCDMRGANLSGASLVEAYIMGSKLSQVDLSNAWLENTDLRWSKIENANLKDVQMPGSNLEGTSLKNSNLSNADLDQASLKNSRLDGAILTGCRLSRADLSGAVIDGTVLLGQPRKEEIIEAKLLPPNGTSSKKLPFYSRHIVSCNLKNARFQGTYIRNVFLTPSLYQNAQQGGAILENVHVVPVL